MLSLICKTILIFNIIILLLFPTFQYSIVENVLIIYKPYLAIANYVFPLICVLITIFYYVL